MHRMAKLLFNSILVAWDGGEFKTVTPAIYKAFVQENY